VRFKNIRLRPISVPAGAESARNGLPTAAIGFESGKHEQKL
jgi:hypothetical protein